MGVEIWTSLIERANLFNTRVYAPEYVDMEHIQVKIACQRIAQRFNTHGCDARRCWGAYSSGPISLRFEKIYIYT